MSERGARLEIKLIISDFDGTLVDTQEANFLAYNQVLKEVGYSLTKEKYAECFGLRFDHFMAELSIHDLDLLKRIQARKAEVYPDYFSSIVVNQGLAKFIENFQFSGGHTALASTARRRNLGNVLAFTKLHDFFDIIIAGEDIEHPKPNPECYLRAMSNFCIEPENCLIFEDSDVGVKAAAASGASYIVVKEFFDGN